MRSKQIVLTSAAAINLFLIYRYFSTLVTTGNRSANGFGAVFLIMFLGVLNTILFVIYFGKRFSLVRVGLLFAILPVICAFIFGVTQGRSMFDEGAGGGGYLWLLIFTLPIGLSLVVVGLIVKLAKRHKPK